jgi:hypothetical protein
MPAKEVEINADRTAEHHSLLFQRQFSANNGTRRKRSPARPAGKRESASASLGTLKRDGSYTRLSAYGLAQLVLGRFCVLCRKR